MSKILFLMALLSFNLFAKADIAIVGGHEVDPKSTDVGYIVSIGGICAGNIIAPSWILTVAHCEVFFGKPITAGSTDLRDNNRIHLVVKNHYIHPDFKVGYHGQNINDFALIELAEPIDFTKTKLSRIALATPAFAAADGLNEGVMATAFGWGKTSERESENSPKLRQVDVPIVGLARANARSSYNGIIDETMLVAGYDEGGKDACEGDSGGPLTVVDQVTGKPILAGLASFGEGCARPNYYGVYSKVSSAYDWIVRTVRGQVVYGL